MGRILLAYRNGLGVASSLGIENLAIVPKRGAILGAEEIQAFCKGRIAHYKVPRYVKFTDGFPMTVM